MFVEMCVRLFEMLKNVLKLAHQIGSKTLKSKK